VFILLSDPGSFINETSMVYQTQNRMFKFFMRVPHRWYIQNKDAANTN